MRVRGAAWILVTVSACGGAIATPSEDGGALTFDAGVDASLDAGADAWTLDATSNAPIVVQLSGQEVEGAEVVFQSADGLVLDSTTAAADGRVIHGIGPGVVGGMVTVVFPTKPPSLVTVQGVAPGDVIPIADFQHPALPSIPLEVKVPDYSGATSYMVRVGACQFVGATSTITGMVESHCVRSGIFAVLVEPTPASNNTYAFKTGNTLLGTGTTKIDLTPAGAAAWSTETESVATLMTGRIGTAASLSTVLTEIADNTVSFSQQINVPIAGDGTYSTTFSPPKNFAQAHDVWWTAVEGNETREVVRRVTGSGAQLVSLHSDAFPPRVTSIVLSELETARPTAAWVHASASNIDGHIMSLQAEDSSFSWTIVTGPTVTTARFPELPSTVSLVRVFGGSAVARITAVVSDGMSGYDEFRTIAPAFHSRSDFFAGRIQAGTVTLAERTFPPP